MKKLLVLLFLVAAVQLFCVEQPAFDGGIVITNSPNPLKDFTAISFDLPQFQQLDQRQALVPLKDFTAISFDLPSDLTVEAVIYNDKNQLVKTIYVGFLSKGYHTFTWDATAEDGKSLPNGTYEFTLKVKEWIDTPQYISVKKMVIWK